MAANEEIVQLKVQPETALEISLIDQKGLENTSLYLSHNTESEKEINLEEESIQPGRMIEEKKDCVETSVRDIPEEPLPIKSNQERQVN